MVVFDPMKIPLLSKLGVDLAFKNWLITSASYPAHQNPMRNEPAQWQTGPMQVHGFCSTSLVWARLKTLLTPTLQHRDDFFQ